MSGAGRTPAARHRGDARGSTRRASGGLLCCGVLRAHRRQQFRASGKQQGLALRVFVAVESTSSPSSPRCARPPAIGPGEAGIIFQCAPELGLGGKPGSRGATTFAGHLVCGGDIQMTRRQRPVRRRQRRSGVGPAARQVVSLSNQGLPSGVEIVSDPVVARARVDPG